MEKFRESDPTNDDAKFLPKLRQMSRRIRLQRAIVNAIRIPLLIHLLLVPWLVIKQVLPIAPEQYLLVLCLAGACGVLVGLLAPLSLLEVASRLDARLALQERLQTALEFYDRRSLPLVDALIEDAAAKVLGIRPTLVFPLKLPREALYLLPTMALAAALLWLPPLPLLGVPAIHTAQFAESVTEDTATAQSERPAVVQDPPQPVQHQSLEVLPASFKDTPFAIQPPDFVSFLREGGDSLSVLDPSANRSPQHDYGQHPHRVSVGRMQEGRLTMETQQFYGEEAARRMEELDELWGPGHPRSSDDNKPEAQAQTTDASSDGNQYDDGTGFQQMPVGQRIEAPKGKPGDRHEQSKGKRFGGLQYPHDAPGGGLPPWLGGPRNPGFQDAGMGSGESTGKTSGQPGIGHSLQTKGAQTPRIDVRSEQHLRLIGQLQEGDQDSYDTDLLGLGAKVPSRQSYRELRSKYTRMAEETLSREWVPFDYREQVKRYFSAIEAR